MSDQAGRSPERRLYPEPREGLPDHSRGGRAGLGAQSALGHAPRSSHLKPVMGAPACHGPGLAGGAAVY